jgi:hypothetical protein
MFDASFSRLRMKPRCHADDKSFMFLAIEKMSLLEKVSVARNPIPEEQ